MTSVDEPQTVKQAMKTGEWKQWQAAMNEELQSHVQNKTWSIVRRTNDMNVIGSRWIFKKKKDVDGRVSRYKGRVVAKGFNQEYGVD